MVKISLGLYPRFIALRFAKVKPRKINAGINDTTRTTRQSNEVGGKD